MADDRLDAPLPPSISLTNSPRDCLRSWARLLKAHQKGSSRVMLVLRPLITIDRFFTSHISDPFGIGPRVGFKRPTSRCNGSARNVQSGAGTGSLRVKRQLGGYPAVRATKSELRY